MATLDLDHFDRGTEIGITQAKSGLCLEEAEKIVDLVRAFREKGKYEFAPTVRAPIMIAKVTKVREAAVDSSDAFFREICLDVLCSETSRRGIRSDGRESREFVQGLLQQFCGRRGPESEAGPPAYLPQGEAAVV